MKKRTIMAVITAMILTLTPATVMASDINDGDNSVSSNNVPGTAITEMESVNDAVQEQIAGSVSALMEQSAAQNTQEYVTVDNAFATLKDRLVNGEAISLTQAASGVEGFNFDYSVDYDLSKMVLIGGIDLAQVNYDYNNIIATMQLGTDLNLSESQMTAMELFDVTYEGVYEAVKLDDLSIDAMYEGLNVNEALNGIKIEFANDFAESISTGSFAAVKDLLSIGNVFSLASGDLTTSSLKSMNYLTSLTAGQNAQNLSIAQQANNIDFEDLQNRISGIADFKDIITGGSGYTMTKFGDGYLIYKDGEFVTGMENSGMGDEVGSNSSTASTTSVFDREPPLGLSSVLNPFYGNQYDPGQRATNEFTNALIDTYGEEYIMDYINERYNGSSTRAATTTVTAAELEQMLSTGLNRNTTGIIPRQGLITSDGVYYDRFGNIMPTGTIGE